MFIFGKKVAKDEIKEIINKFEETEANNKKTLDSLKKIFED